MSNILKPIVFKPKKDTTFYKEYVLYYNKKYIGYCYRCHKDSNYACYFDMLYKNEEYSCNLCTLDDAKEYVNYLYQKEHDKFMQIKTKRLALGKKKNVSI